MNGTQKYPNLVIKTESKNSDNNHACVYCVKSL